MDTILDSGAYVNKRASTGRLPRGHTIEVELAGAIVRVRDDFDAKALREVVRALRDTLMR